MSGARKSEPEAGLRIDRWLWYARFYKTRSLAGQAVRGGHVRFNGERIKPAHAVKIGDTLTILRDTLEFEVTVAAIPERRGPAAEALSCFVESSESIERRRAQAETHAAAPALAAPTRGRPDKRTRRLILRARQRS
jgi:ribosome-associated heat shock protein Hsp15